MHKEITIEKWKRNEKLIEYLVESESRLRLHLQVANMSVAIGALLAYLNPFSDNIVSIH